MSFALNWLRWEGFRTSFTSGLAGSTVTGGISSSGVRISSLGTKLSCHFPQGTAEDACSEKYVDGLFQKTGENYQWPIDAQGNMSKGSFGHPEVSCKPEFFFLWNVPAWSWIASIQGHPSCWRGP